MRTITTLAALTALTLAGNAPVITDNPHDGVAYIARLPVSSSSSSPSGIVKATSGPNGTGTKFHVTFHNLPSGIVTYGIYTGRVGSAAPTATTTPANCALMIGELLNPYNGTTGAACTPATPPQTCAIGDLGGKNGYISTPQAGEGFSAEYIDDYLSLNPSSESFFGGGRLVVGDGDGAAIACTDFVEVDRSLTTTTTISRSTASSQTTSSSSSSSLSPSSTTVSATIKEGSSTTSNNAAGPTAIVQGLGSGVVGLAAAAAVVVLL